MILRKYLCNPKLCIKTILQQKYIMFVHLLVLFLSTTLPAIIRNSSEYNRMNIKRDVTEFLTEPSMFLTVIIPVAAFMAAFLAFSHLYKKKSAIFVAATPDRRSCDYLTRVFAACISAIIPYLIISIVNIAFMYGYGYNYSGASFATGLIAVIFQYILTTAICCFVSSVSGGGFAQFVSFAVFCLIIPVTRLTVASAIDHYFVTWWPDYEFNEIYQIPWISILNRGMYDCFFYIFCGIELITVTVIGTFCYIKRKVENTDNFFAYKFINIILKYYGSLIIGVLGSIILSDLSDSNNVGAYVSCIIISAVAFSIIQGIFEKSFKSMFSNVKGFLLVAVISAAVITIPVLDPLKFDETVPHIKSISINPIDSNFYHYTITGSGENLITLESPEILYIAKPMIENGFDEIHRMENEDDDHDYDKFQYSNIRINSIPASRYFAAPKEEYEKFIKTVFNSDEYKQEFLKVFDKFDSNAVVEFNKNSLNIHNRIVLLDELLKEALANDIENADYDTVKGSVIFCRLHFQQDNFSLSLPIYSCYENTVELLNEKSNLPKKRNYTTVSIMRYQDKYGNYEEKEYVITDPELIEKVIENTSDSYNSLNEGTNYDVFGNGSYIGTIAENMVPEGIFE